MISLKSRFPERELLHRGDLALSYRARDSVLERDVFIKVMNPALAHDGEIRARFEREAKAVARLDHPNLVRIYEYGQDADEGMYMLLEWVEGSNLAHRLTNGSLSHGELNTLARDLLAGLAALHSVGIVHRDLKPENVLVKIENRKSKIEISESPPLTLPRAGGNATFKITDFSLAALRDAPTLTHHEAIVGTPAYMSPEQAAGGKVDERSDLFALGVILYEAATGVNPLVGQTMIDTLRKIRESDISFEHAKIIALPPALRSLLERLLMKDPARRPQSAKDGLALLNGEIALDPPPAQSRKRTIYYAALAGLVILFWAVMMVQMDRGQDEETPARVLPDSERATRETKHDSVGIISDTARPKIIPVSSAQDLFTGVPNAGTELRTSPPKDTTSRIKVLQTTEEVSGDTIDFWLSTEPWAHVLWQGKRVATTPLAAPLRLAGGVQTLQLENPAYPAIDVVINTSESQRLSVRLADKATLLKINALPWAEFYLDGEHVGTTPLSKPPFISPGRHSIRLTHPSYGAQQKEFSARGGDTIWVECDLTRALLAIKP